MIRGHQHRSFANRSQSPSTRRAVVFRACWSCAPPSWRLVQVDGSTQSLPLPGVLKKGVAHLVTVLISICCLSQICTYIYTHNRRVVYVISTYIYIYILYYNYLYVLVTTHFVVHVLI